MDPARHLSPAADNAIADIRTNAALLTLLLKNIPWSHRDTWMSDRAGTCRHVRLMAWIFDCLSVDTSTTCLFLIRLLYNQLICLVPLKHLANGKGVAGKSKQRKSKANGPKLSNVPGQQIWLSN